MPCAKNVMACARYTTLEGKWLGQCIPNCKGFTEEVSHFRREMGLLTEIIISNKFDFFLQKLRAYKKNPVARAECCTTNGCNKDPIPPKTCLAGENGTEKVNNNKQRTTNKQ